MMGTEEAVLQHYSERAVQKRGVCVSGWGGGGGGGGVLI